MHKLVKKMKDINELIVANIKKMKEMEEIIDYIEREITKMKVQSAFT